MVLPGPLGLRKTEAPVTTMLQTAAGPILQACSSTHTLCVRDLSSLHANSSCLGSHNFSCTTGPFSVIMLDRWNHMTRTKALVRSSHVGDGSYAYFFDLPT